MDNETKSVPKTRSEPCRNILSPVDKYFQDYMSRRTNSAGNIFEKSYISVCYIYSEKAVEEFQELFSSKPNEDQIREVYYKILGAEMGIRLAEFEDFYASVMKGYKEHAEKAEKWILDAKCCDSIIDQAKNLKKMVLNLKFHCSTYNTLIQNLLAANKNQAEKIHILSMKLHEIAKISTET